MLETLGVILFLLVMVAAGTSDADHTNNTGANQGSYGRKDHDRDDHHDSTWCENDDA